MKLLTKTNLNKLTKNFAINNARLEDTIDFEPVVKLFTPDAGATWLLTELDPETNLAFGLCDLGHGSPELGYLSLDELMSVRGPFGLPIERDRWFTANKTLGAYANDARKNGRVAA